MTASQPRTCGTQYTQSPCAAKEGEGGKRRTAILAKPPSQARHQLINQWESMD